MKTAHDVKLLNGSKQEVSYTGVETVTMPGTDGQDKVFTAGAPIDALDISPDFSGGDMPLEAPEGYVVRGATIKKPEGAEQVIAKGQTVAGIVGEYVTSGTAKEIEPDFSEGDQTVTAEGDERWSEVTVKKPDGLLPGNITKGVEIAGVVGEARMPEDPIFEDDTDGLEDVRFYDMDGTIVYRCSVEEAGQLTALPVPPSHDGFLFQEWNHTLEDVVSAKHPLDVGANYTTADGKTVFTVKILTNTTNVASGTVTMTFYQSVGNGVEISIDGGAAKTVSGTGQVSISIGTFSTAVGTSKEVTFTAAEGCIFYVVRFSSIKYGSYVSYTPTVDTAKIGYCYDLSNTIVLSDVKNIPIGMTSVTNSAKIGAKYFPIPRSVTEISKRPHYGNCYMLSLPRNVNVTYVALSEYVYADRIIFPETLTKTQSLSGFYGKYVYFPDGLSTVKVDGTRILKVRLPAQPFTLNSVSSTRMSKFTVPANATINMSVSSPSAYDGLFSYCNNLREIVFDGCTVANAELNRNIAYQCPFLTKIRFPQGVTSISGYIANYVSAETLVIPEGVESISFSNFMSSSVSIANEALALIVCPSTLTKLTGLAWAKSNYGDSLCAIVYLSAESPPLQFYNTTALWNCYVKDEIVESMKEAYATYKDRIKPLSELPSGVKELINQEYGGII